MNQYRIHNRQSGVVLGTFEGKNESEALDNMAIDAGYTSYKDIEISFGRSDDLIVEYVEMTFDEAKRALKDLAKGDYCAIYKETSIDVDNKEKSIFTVYIDVLCHCSGETWIEALNKMKVQIEKAKEADSE